MKNRTITLVLVACCVSSFAFADNPSDAPLVIDNGSAAVVQQDNQQKNCVDRGRKHKNKDKQNASQVTSPKTEAVATGMLKDGYSQEGKSEPGQRARTVQ
jgi:hypothetical protein